MGVLREEALARLNLAIVDVETTGGRAVEDRIIELGIKRVEGGRVVDTFSTLIDPERSIPPWITQLTGIADEDVAGAPTFGAIHQQVRGLLDACVFVAHNARFDYGFIRHEFERLSHEFQADCLCTVRLSRRLYPRHRKHDLSSLIERFGFPCANRHRALDDADVVWSFLQHAQATINAGRFADAMRSVLVSMTAPAAVPPQILRELPSAPGVYVLYDGDHVPLYVGSGLDIRERVLAHFRDDRRAGAQRFCQQAAHIDTHPTHGRLGARLLESALIKQLAPRGNRRPSARRRPAVLRYGSRRDGYDTVRIDELQLSEIDDPASLLGIFPSRPKAMVYLAALAAEHGLCARFLGLETSEHCCLSHDAALVHNARLHQALASRRIKPWPFRGPVLIEECRPDRTRGHVFILDQWRLLQAMEYDEDGRRMLPWVDPGFDYDRYQLFARHVAQMPRLTPLSAEQVQRLVGELEVAADVS